MHFADVARASAAVATTSSRLRKIELIADALRAAGPDIGLVARYLSGELRQRRTGVGYAAARALSGAAAAETLTVSDVDAAFQAMAACAGSGSQTARQQLLADLFVRATPDEQRLLFGLIGGELRQGALASVVTDAVAKASDAPVAAVRRAVMLRGDLAAVAEQVLTHGPAALAQFQLEVGRPVQPMLASTAADLADAFGKVSPAAVEWKLDGVRIQVHRTRDDVRVWTRSLDEITDRVPEVVAAVCELDAATLVLDGEAIALARDGRPLPFQVTGSRVATRGAGQADVPLTSLFFDVLHVDGADLTSAPGQERWAALARLLPEALRVPRLVTDDVAAATAFADDALARGHEGVVVKSLDATYDAGRRGAGWLKVKPRHTLDLVVLAAEWGHGRRKGWLSNLHLGARDPAGGWVMLGKTFKGLTDDLLRWQTERLLELEESRNDWQVFVRPELVVEIAFDGVQTSPRYEGGVALRFARVLRYREDKTADQADTIDDVRRIHAR